MIIYIYIYIFYGFCGNPLKLEINEGIMKMLLNRLNANETDASKYSTAFLFRRKLHDSLF